MRRLARLTMSWMKSASGQRGVKKVRYDETRAECGWTVEHTDGSGGYRDGGLSGSEEAEEGHGR